MWREEVSAPLHSYHFGFAFGTVIGPFVVGPFLLLSADHTNTSCKHFTEDIALNRVYQYQSMSHNSVGNSTRIEIPYGIGGGLGVFVAITFFIFFIHGLPNQFKKESNTNYGSQRQS